MKRIFRKNQMIITALAVLIAVAGYISYTNAGADKMPGKEHQASLTEEQRGSDTNDQQLEEIGLLDLSEEDLAGSIFTDTEDPAALENQVALNGDSETVQPAPEETDAGTAILTSSTSDVASQMRLTREQTRSKNKETLMEIVNNENLGDEQKADAIEQLEQLTDIAEKETAAENLLLAKGFTDVVVSISEDGVDVVLNMGDVSEAKRAQVEDIVKRKTGVEAEKIVITPIASK